jgi:hypothetical protein
MDNHIILLILIIILIVIIINKKYSKKNNENFEIINSPSTLNLVPDYKLPIKSYSGIAINNDGTRMAVCVYNGGIYTSSDSGNTWQVSNANYSSWTDIRSDITGRFLVACQANNSARRNNLATIFTSIDYGITWNITKAPKNMWKSVTTNGTNLVAASTYYVGDSGYIHYSINSGTTWNKSNSPVGYWYDLKSNSSGQNLVACLYGREVYKSVDFGITWVQVSNQKRTWYSVATNEDCSIIIGASFEGLFISRNNSDWVSIFKPIPFFAYTPEINYYSVALSFDLSKLIIGTSKGLYTFNWKLNSDKSDDLNNNLLLSNSNNWRKISSADTNNYKLLSTYDGKKIIAKIDNNIYLITNS